MGGGGDGNDVLESLCPVSTGSSSSSSSLPSPSLPSLSLPFLSLSLPESEFESTNIGWADGGGAGNGDGNFSLFAFFAIYSFGYSFSFSFLLTLLDGLGVVGIGVDWACFCLDGFRVKDDCRGIEGNTKNCIRLT